MLNGFISFSIIDMFLARLGCKDQIFIGVSLFLTNEDNSNLIHCLAGERKHRNEDRIFVSVCSLFPVLIENGNYKVNRSFEMVIPSLFTIQQSNNS